MSIGEALVSALDAAWKAIDSGFSDAPVGPTAPCDQSGTSKAGQWSVSEVKALIQKTNPEVIERMCKDGVKVASFDTAYDK